MPEAKVHIDINWIQLLPPRSYRIIWQANVHKHVVILNEHTDTKMQIAHLS